MFDLLPTPFGLVRAGVAPDHPKIKSVTRVYEKTAAKPGFRFFGNVDVGEDVTHAELTERYHAVIYAVGAQTDRQHGDPGRGPARQLGGHRVRGLVQRPSGLPRPGVRPVLQARGRDRQRQRGDGRGADARAPARGAGGHRHGRPRDRGHGRERRGGGRDHRPPRARPGRLHQPRAAGARRAHRRRRDRGPGRCGARRPQRALDRGRGRDHPATQRRDPHRLLRARAARASASGWCCASSAHPWRSRATAGSRGSSWCATSSSTAATARCAPTPRASTRRWTSGWCSARSATAECRSRACRSTSGTAPIPNEEGRVVDPHAQRAIPGEYVVGWIKRGPSGVIGTNKRDAQETVDHVLEDLAREPAARARRHRLRRDRGAGGRAQARVRVLLRLGGHRRGGEGGRRAARPPAREAHARGRDAGRREVLGLTPGR